MSIEKLIQRKSEFDQQIREKLDHFLKQLDKTGMFAPSITKVAKLSYFIDNITYNGKQSVTVGITIYQNKSPSKFIDSYCLHYPLWVVNNPTKENVTKYAHEIRS